MRLPYTLVIHGTPDGYGGYSYELLVVSCATPKSALRAALRHGHARLGSASLQATLRTELGETRMIDVHVLSHPPQA